MASGSNGGTPPSAVPDERKRKRMQSNRDSARRSRMRKQKQLEDFTGEVSRLQIANGQLLQSIGAKEQAFVQVDNMNNVLRAQAMELTDRLRSLNSVLHIVEELNQKVLVLILVHGYPKWERNMSDYKLEKPQMSTVAYTNPLCNHSWG